MALFFWPGLLDGERLRPWRDEGESLADVSGAGKRCPTARPGQPLANALCRAWRRPRPNGRGWAHGLLMPMERDAHGDGVGYGVGDAGREVNGRTTAGKPRLRLVQQ